MSVKIASSLPKINLNTYTFRVRAPPPAISFDLIHEGVKSLPLQKFSLDVLIFRHQSITSVFDMKSKEWVPGIIPISIEIVAFDHSSLESKAPHLFLSPKTFYDQLDVRMRHDADRDLLASDLIVKFVLNRIMVSSFSLTSFEISLSAPADDGLKFIPIEIKRPSDTSNIHDQLKLRKRRFVTNTCDFKS
jgi:hypothetical protein